MTQTMFRALYTTAGVYPGGVGGGGYSTKLYTGRFRPEVQPLTLLYPNINRKGTPLEDLVFRGPDQLKLIPRVPFYSELERILGTNRQ